MSAATNGTAFLRFKKLKGHGIIKAAARHNRREIQSEIGANGSIEPIRSTLNETLQGPSTADGVAQLAKDLMAAAGVGQYRKVRKDFVACIELVFSLPPAHGINDRAYFVDCAAWAGQWFSGDQNILSVDIPASRMKMKTPHIVPLSPQAVDLLKILQTISGERELLFPGERDHAKPISNNTILGALDRMGYKGKMTGHGFRGVASTVLHEHGFPHEHIELQLAHIERNSVSAAYNHALYLDPRTTMMAWWGNYLEAVSKGNVLPLRKLSD